MGGSVLSFLKAEWKVSDTDSTHWASSLSFVFLLSWKYLKKEKKFVSKYTNYGDISSFKKWFYNWAPRYNWNIVETGVKHQLT
jgi:hypothetical protein